MKNGINESVLELFGCVLKTEHVLTKPENPIVDLRMGIIVMPDAYYALDLINRWRKKHYLDGAELNKSFHKSFETVRSMSNLERIVHQVLHYMTTYGTDFRSPFVYIPAEELEVPQIDQASFKFRLVDAISVPELMRKLGVMLSGMALKQETMELVCDLFARFKGDMHVVLNKEALIYLADNYGMYPTEPVEMLRYIVYKMTNKTLLIKNKDTYVLIGASSFNPCNLLDDNAAKLASIFNRFKPIFMAMKNDRTREVINKISKLSKKLHKPMDISPLNMATRMALSTLEMETMTTIQLIRIINVMALYMKNPAFFMYRVRNGKAWIRDGHIGYWGFFGMNFNTAISVLRRRVKLTGKKFFIPDSLDYVVPTSEKSFVGNIPEGTRFYTSKFLNVGVYWRNEWGAHDIDLSGLLHNGVKVGWNNKYYRNGLTYSGDMTDASDGAVEYINFQDDQDLALVTVNIFAGEKDAGYSIVIGEGSNHSVKHMMDPNKVIAMVRTKAPSRQAVLGIFHLFNGSKCFTISNLALGASRVSKDDELNRKTREAMLMKYNAMFTLKDFVDLCGGICVERPEEADYDFSVGSVTPDMFMDLLR